MAFSGFGAVSTVIKPVDLPRFGHWFAALNAVTVVNLRHRQGLVPRAEGFFDFHPSLGEVGIIHWKPPL